LTLLNNQRKLWLLFLLWFIYCYNGGCKSRVGGVKKRGRV